MRGRIWSIKSEAFLALHCLSAEGDELTKISHLCPCESKLYLFYEFHRL